MGELIEIWDVKKKSLLRLTAKFPATYNRAAFSPKLDRMACKHGHDLVILALK